jgi:hypothetical protein
MAVFAINGFQRPHASRPHRYDAPTFFFRGVQALSVLLIHLKKLAVHDVIFRVFDFDG